MNKNGQNDDVKKTLTNLSKIGDNIHANNLISQKFSNILDNKKSDNLINNYKSIKNNGTNIMNIELKEYGLNESQLIKDSNTKIYDNQININKINNERNKNILNQLRENFDNLAHLEKRYLDEKEEKMKIEADKRIHIYRDESNKKLTRKLITYSEYNINKILKIIDFVICFFVLSDISLSIFTNMRFTTNEYDLNDRLIKESFYTDTQIEDLRICIMCIIFIIQIMIVIKYKFKLMILRSSLFASDKDTIFTIGLYKKMLLEMVALIIFTPPYTNGYFKGNMLFGFYTYSSDSFILLVKLIKLYYLIIIFSHVSLWTSDTAREIAKENKVTIGANFALKATLKKNPFMSILILLGIFLLLFSFFMRIFEYGFSQEENDKIISNAKAIENESFGSYANVFWVVIITMMTVGYGDSYPKTHMGRTVAFLSSIVGMIIQSLLIVRLSDFVELTVDEKKAFNEIKKVDDQKLIEVYAISLIKCIIKLIQIKRDNKLDRKNK